MYSEKYTYLPQLGIEPIYHSNDTTNYHTNKPHNKNTWNRIQFVSNLWIQKYVKVILLRRKVCKDEPAKIANNKTRRTKTMSRILLAVKRCLKVKILHWIVHISEFILAVSEWDINKKISDKRKSGLPTEGSVYNWRSRYFSEIQA